MTVTYNFSTIINFKSPKMSKPLYIINPLKTMMMMPYSHQSVVTTALMRNLVKLISTKSFSILHFNIHPIQGHVDELRTLLLNSVRAKNLAQAFSSKATMSLIIVTLSPIKEEFSYMHPLNSISYPDLTLKLIHLMKLNLC